jgi:hypothetical protein
LFEGRRKEGRKDLGFRLRIRPSYSATIWCFELIQKFRYLCC